MTDEHEADTAAYFAGVARNKLYEVDGLERSGQYEAAYRALWTAEHSLKTALRNLQEAKDRIGKDHYIDDQDFGLRAYAVAPAGQGLSA